MPSRLERIPAVLAGRSRKHTSVYTERVFSDSPNGMLVISPRGVILEVNAAFCKATGYLPAEVRGRTPAFLKSGVHGAEFHARLWQSLRDAGSWHGELVSRRKDGSLLTDFLTVGAVRNRVGRISHYICVFSDIAALKERQHRLERLAYFDPLTSLPNRRLLMDRLGQMCAAARRHGRQVAVCYLDIDGFKGINDRLGHHVGDRVLVDVATRLGREIRIGDTVARLGGDEFVIIFAEPGTVADIQAVLDRILDSLARAPVEHETAGVSVSIGVTIFPMDDGSPDTLLRHADKAMYQAKRSGRARYCFFYPLGGRTLANDSMDPLACR